ncbi:hypothetical protein PAECIP111893_03908 [Paenibacillus plantiphilus]|uniref:SH3b domain-containing protein n=1 Tax=Paenibacillus plantiphilus TaxID=2905650 RepID=A0ABM9CL99_9BACL|nr:N-acetylmuramoyl-L-alanine amidase [Paenibacillus plantiphilus]CAH1215272.1 hypothetical protein PAECIP111893_03908 [Paenibacillus plantiphilus]
MRKLINAVMMLSVLLGLACYGPEPVEAKGEYTAKAIGSAINVRDEPSLEGTVVGSLNNGDIVTVSQEKHGWLQIKNDKVSGWAAGYLLKKVDGSSERTAVNDKAAVSSKSANASDKATSGSAVKKAAAGQATVLADSLRIRSGAGLNYKVLGGVVQGELVTVLEEKGDWAQIRTKGGLVGWVSAAYIGEGTAVKPASGKLAGKVIVIDPGHGGGDPGKIGIQHNTLEKELNLSTSFYLVEELRSRGAHVVMTRTKDDQKPALSDRVRTSKAAGADAFVSIHYNSSEKNTSGILTFYHSDTKDKPLAHAIENRLGEGIGLKSNGVSFGDLHVLRENDTASVLVELGFLSNVKDEAIVRESAYQKKAAAAIAKGLEDYFGI